MLADDIPAKYPAENRTALTNYGLAEYADRVANGIVSLHQANILTSENISMLTERPRNIEQTVNSLIASNSRPSPPH